MDLGDALRVAFTSTLLGRAAARLNLPSAMQEATPSGGHSVLDETLSLRTMGDDAARLEPSVRLLEDLLSQDVCVAAVLREFAQHVQVDPAKRQRTAAVAVHDVVDVQVGDRLAGASACIKVCIPYGADVVVAVQDERLLGAGRDTISARL